MFSALGGTASATATAAAAAAKRHVTATIFNAEAHVKLFTTSFDNLNIRISDFVIAQIADRTALNPRIARLLNCFHIACRNHCLNLACKDMENNCEDLKRLATKTQEIHRKIKASNKLSA